MKAFRIVLFVGASFLILGAQNLSAASSAKMFEVARIFGSTVVVDFGTEERPTDELELQMISVVSDSASAMADLVNIRKKCAKVCDEPACHFVGTYRLKGKEVLQMPAVAFPGRQAIAQVTKAQFLALKKSPVQTVREWSSSIYNGTSLFRLMWADEKQVAVHYSRYEDYAAPGKYFESEPFSFSVAACKASAFNGFQKLDCPAAAEPSGGHAWLYDGAVPILESDTDGYGTAKITLVSTFLMNGKRQYLFLVGGKGSDFLVTLYKDGPNWMQLRTFKNYATMC